LALFVSTWYPEIWVRYCICGVVLLYWSLLKGQLCKAFPWTRLGFQPVVKNGAQLRVFLFFSSKKCTRNCITDDSGYRIESC
jgi:hypothetical protein